MKKINELVTNPEKAKRIAKRKITTFESYKRAEDKQVQERREKKHQEELARIAEEAQLNKELSDALIEEEERVIKEENTRKRNEFITGSLKNAFGTKTEVDMNPVREEVIDKYLPKLKEPEKIKRPTLLQKKPQ